MAKRLWTVSLAAERKHDGNAEAAARSARAQAIAGLAYINADHEAYVVVHTSLAILGTAWKGDAEKKALQRAKEIFPEEEGWENHSVSAGQIPDHVVVEAARALLPEYHLT